MHRAVVFAHYDKYNSIQEYVLYYLKELRKVADTIIFVSDPKSYSPCGVAITSLTRGCTLLLQLRMANTILDHINAGLAIYQMIPMN